VFVAFAGGEQAIGGQLARAMRVLHEHAVQEPDAAADEVRADEHA